MNRQQQPPPADGSPGRPTEGGSLAAPMPPPEDPAAWLDAFRREMDRIEAANFVRIPPFRQR
jgi:hypothetical protein